MSNNPKKSTTSSSVSKGNRNYSSSSMKDDLKNINDSGRADSGFLSSGNLLSDSSYSAEIHSHDSLDYSGDLHQDKMFSTSCSGLATDSGVDIGMSDQFSKMGIQDQFCEPISPSASLYSSTNIASFEAETESNYLARLKSFFQKDEYGHTKLHIAVLSDSIQDVRNLITMIPSPDYLDITNDLRQTALHLAVLMSSPQLVHILVVSGARTDCVDHHGNTPLHLAVAAADLPCVKELLLQPVPEYCRSLQLRYSPKHRSPPPKELDMVNYEGMACVHLAMTRSNGLDILRELVTFGADINAQEYKSGRSVMHLAAEKGDLSIVEILIRELSADPHILTYAGESPYRVARRDVADGLKCLGAYAIGDSDDEDEDHLASHEDDPDYQMTGPSFRELQSNNFTVSA